MRRNLYWISLFLCLFATTFCSCPANAEDLTHRFGIGLNYPGVSVKYGLSQKFSIEGKYQTADKINVMGPRLYFVIKDCGKLNLLAGLEADYVTFTGDVSKGSGLAGELFVGGEYFITRNLSFLLDIGPAYVALSDTATSESVNGLDSVLNMGINYYFGK